MVDGKFTWSLNNKYVSEYVAFFANLKRRALLSTHTLAL